MPGWSRSSSNRVGGFICCYMKFNKWNNNSDDSFADWDRSTLLSSALLSARNGSSLTPQLFYILFIHIVIDSEFIIGLILMITLVAQNSQQASFYMHESSDTWLFSRGYHDSFRLSCFGNSFMIKFTSLNFESEACIRSTIRLVPAPTHC